MSCSFVDLTKALDPEKYFRAEKTTIIADTIKMLNSMRLENEQLREERKALRVCFQIVPGPIYRESYPTALAACSHIFLRAT